MLMPPNRKYFPLAGMPSSSPWWVPFDRPGHRDLVPLGDQLLDRGAHVREGGDVRRPLLFGACQSGRLPGRGGAVEVVRRVELLGAIHLMLVEDHLTGGAQDRLVLVWGHGCLPLR